MQRIKQIPHEENQYINIRVVDTSQVQMKNTGNQHVLKQHLAQPML